ncbi:hypothetical protein IPC1488_31630 [Pseudomonas aeruginosa]|nr:hypothetical protein IPC1488_31630 [Pseudomonas aeruginosa]
MRTYPQFGQRSQRKHQMPDPASTSAGSAALLKMFGIHISAGALAAALGFLVLWPRTVTDTDFRISNYTKSAPEVGNAHLSAIRAALATEAPNA